MKVTLDIDDDVLYAARDLARSEGRTMGDTISKLARRGLSVSVMRGGVPVLPSRGEVVTCKHIRRLLDSEGD